MQRTNVVKLSKQLQEYFTWAASDRFAGAQIILHLRIAEVVLQFSNKSLQQ